MHENNQSQVLKWPKVSPPTPPPPFVSTPLSAPLFNKRSVLLSNSKKKTAGNPDLFLCSDYFY